MYKVLKNPKVLALLILGFGIKLYFSCTPPDPIEMYYNNIKIVGMDNTGKYLTSNNELGTFYSEAVAMELTLSDTSMYYTASNSTGIMQAFSFRSAQATSIHLSYIPVNKVTDIKVKTLLDINESIKAGDDISAHILYPSEDTFDLYYDLSRGISRLNGAQNYASSSIVLVLKASVQNTNAQFEVTVTLDSGYKLLCKTEIFTIIES